VANQQQNIYFLGIGGIGMSNLARYFHLKGEKVSGYDKTPSVVTDALEKLGIQIFFEPNIANVENINKMVYTPAIKEHIELEYVKSAGIPLLKRSQMLGEISREYKTLAVAGTHGKTTTTTLLTWLLRSCDVDATGFLGGISNNFEGNFVFGHSEYAVVEADEFDRSFLTLSPEMAIITSLDADHLDIYGNADEVENSYRDFGRKVNPNGKLLVHHSIQNFDWGREVKTYGIDEGEFRAENLRTANLRTTFDYVSKDLIIKDIELNWTGRHNILNAVAAITLTFWAGGNMAKVKESLLNFKGIYRRLETKFHSETLSYLDDYAHHPTEIDSALAAAKNLFPDRQLVVVFQPHLFTRTRDFLEGFGRSLSVADVLLLLPIYPAREKPIEGIVSEKVLELVTSKTKKVIQKTEIMENLEKYVSKPSIIVTIGAGDIDREVAKIQEWVKNNAEN
jgi:UDP-N-acetylmuramate--alanine ligase